jgi:hypothetical protein
VADFSNAREWHSTLSFPRHNNLPAPVVKATDLQFSLEVPFLVLVRAAKDANSEYDKILSGSISGVLDQGVRKHIASRTVDLRPDSLLDNTSAILGKLYSKILSLLKSATTEVCNIQFYRL